MNINWYPGHMAKTKRQIQEDLKLIDVIVEILDARIPVASQNPDIGKWIEGKKKLFVLNKCDLASESENKKAEELKDLILKKEAIDMSFDYGGKGKVSSMSVKYSVIQ